MPYKSDAQRRYFNANRTALEAQGVDVDEWNDSSRGKKLPKRSKKKKSREKRAYGYSDDYFITEHFEPSFYGSAGYDPDQTEASRFLEGYPYLTKSITQYRDTLAKYRKDLVFKLLSEKYNSEAAVTPEKALENLAKLKEMAETDPENFSTWDEEAAKLYPWFYTIEAPRKGLFRRGEPLDAESLPLPYETFSSVYPATTDNKDKISDSAIKLGASRVHGRGLFVTDNKNRGEKIARAMVRMRGEDSLDRYELTKAARYTNHSQYPSAQLIKVGKEVHLVALEDIPAGSEVFVDYCKTAAVLGPGSYITFRGEKRVNWDQLEKQARYGVSFTKKSDSGIRQMLDDANLTFMERAKIPNWGQKPQGVLNAMQNMPQMMRAMRNIQQFAPPAVLPPLPQGKKPLAPKVKPPLKKQGYVNKEGADPISRSLTAFELREKIAALDPQQFRGLIGAGLGAGAGALYNQYRKPDEKGKKKHSRLHDMLIGGTGGAYLGALSTLPFPPSEEPQPPPVKPTINRADIEELPTIDELMERVAADQSINKTSSTKKRADILKEVGDGVAKGVAGFTDIIDDAINEKNEEEKKKEKEEERLQKAVIRNARERKARKIAKRDEWKYAEDASLRAEESDPRTLVDAQSFGALAAKKMASAVLGQSAQAPQASNTGNALGHTADLQAARSQMNAQAAGAGPQQPNLTPEQQQLLSQRPMTAPGVRQPLPPTRANLGPGPLTGDTFSTGAQHGLGMALTASSNNIGNILDRAIDNLGLDKDAKHPTTGRKLGRKSAPRSVTIKKPSRTCPDTGEVTPGSSKIKHVARSGRPLNK
tara:strand:- start:3236 stop:5692 length:2457 start_codon:yes stop_codon:yes gene_type:complete